MYSVLTRALHDVVLGTSADEGLGLCHSICEYLLNLKVEMLIDIDYTDASSPPRMSTTGESTRRGSTVHS